MSVAWQRVRGWIFALLTRHETEADRWLRQEMARLMRRGQR